MESHHEHYHRPERALPWWKTPFGIVVIFFFAVAAYFLVAEHGAHIGGNWIWLILLACPLMHIFMHGGHGGHGSHGGGEIRGSRSDPSRFNFDDEEGK